MSILTNNQGTATVDAFGFGMSFIDMGMGHSRRKRARNSQDWPKQAEKGKIESMSGSTLSVRLSTHARCAQLEDIDLAAKAAEGDGTAFAELYDRYEKKAFNFCYRLTGSMDDAADATQQAFLSVLERLPNLQKDDLNFPAYLLTVARHASYRLMEKRKRSEPTDSIPEPSSGGSGSVGSGGSGWDPVDPHDDPERAVMLDSQQEEIRAANERLPERQREALALRELENLSYDEIAEVMGMNRNSVAQLISRARIGLRDELRSSALLSISAVSPECERALPLISMRQDGQLESESDAVWLDAHLATCQTCLTSREAMQEAGTSYRAWMPIAPAVWLFKDTVAKAAELVGADWSEVQRPGNDGDSGDSGLERGKDGQQVTGPALQRLAHRFGFAGIKKQGKRLIQGSGPLGVLLLFLLPFSVAMAVLEGGKVFREGTSEQQAQEVSVSGAEAGSSSGGEEVNGGSKSQSGVDTASTDTPSPSDGSKDSNGSSDSDDEGKANDSSEDGSFASVSSGSDTDTSRGSRTRTRRLPGLVNGGSGSGGAGSNPGSDDSSKDSNGGDSGQRQRTTRRTNLTTPGSRDSSGSDGGRDNNSSSGTGDGQENTGTQPTDSTGPTTGSPTDTGGRDGSGGEPTSGGDDTPTRDGGSTGGDTRDEDSRTRDGSGRSFNSLPRP